MRAKGKQTPKIIRYLYWAAIVALIIGTAFLNRNSIYKTYRERKKVEILEAKLQYYKAENDSLAKENLRLKTDSDAAEKAAREQFGLIKPGEKVFRFVPAKDSE
ncbi:MAG: septum formation initiator family protein [Candidatus Cloacimonetes bacterium]|jgi:cell division protein FtsB|nr:septum formation initiator family protein [Candidatus Cloacimonadota bacterium]MCB5287416.1 septum formation initiator family protein [Candidatus Cloacimonadota bacterium]MCK9184202.1 septum formation initiator family protein [Candidatus Cloacimonadota bacterium]MCK9583664.1 septum formation initiator family protein [Candidatus Cloacimonadota bacterium]MDY0229737.1 septum formation initiator family protein [Candidatus Cloacimonadaceae bacterium]